MSANPHRTGSYESLKAPVSIAVYDEYEDAQRAVDYLAEHDFPVQKLAIVGTDLKSYEKVTGQLSWGRVIASAAAGGLVWGLGLSLIFWMMSPQEFMPIMIFTVLFFVVINIITTTIGYAARGGRRDFTSTRTIIAAHYEIIGEYDVAAQARNKLSGGSPNAPVRNQPVVNTPATPQTSGHQIPGYQIPGQPNNNQPVNYQPSSYSPQQDLPVDDSTGKHISAEFKPTNFIQESEQPPTANQQQDDSFFAPQGREKENPANPS